MASIKTKGARPDQTGAAARRRRGRGGGRRQARVAVPERASGRSRGGSAASRARSALSERRSARVCARTHTRARVWLGGVGTKRRLGGAPPRESKVGGGKGGRGRDVGKGRRARGTVVPRTRWWFDPARVVFSPPCPLARSHSRW